MSVAIPESILNCRITATTPTDELLTLRHIYSEVGEYASTILDREHMALSKKCATRLKKVEEQLTSRHSILSAEEEDSNILAKVERVAITSIKALECQGLSFLTVNELYDLYRDWSMRHREREGEGREHMTFYFEGRIVKELQKRVAGDKGEQLKIDYCTMTYRNELENMSFIFSLPVSSQLIDLTYPERGREYTASELLSLIKLYSHYRTIDERELLIEYVDMALDLMSATETSTDKVLCMALASELVEIGRKGIISVPGWVSGFLEEAVEAARKDKSVCESELVLPLLTLQLQNGSPKLEREARRIINRCYRRAVALEGDFDILIADLHTAVTCCDYVSRFSIKKIGQSWNELSARLIASIPALEIIKTGVHILTGAVETAILTRLLKIADEIENYAPISSERKAILTELLEQ